MHTLLVLWLLLVGMKDVRWDGWAGSDDALTVEGGHDVASEGPFGPPPPKP